MHKLFLTTKWRQNLRRDEFREPFPDEDSNEDAPEELDTLLLKENWFSSMEGVKELDSRQQDGKNDIGRINEEAAH